ncbi:DUF4240 domain-containing protein [Actinophytocola sp.]|uniref:DUF4240 domain-containing protein n=1 Tax=Actinophytocola sp. TaxID=1872138 RepID=UPI002ED4F278
MSLSRPPEPSDEFWSVVESADPVAALHAMPLDALVRFHEELLDTAQSLTHDYPWADHMEESEDGREDVAYWVISQGREYYTEIVHNPSKIPHSVWVKPTGALHTGLTIRESRVRPPRVTFSGTARRPKP